MVVGSCGRAHGIRGEVAVFTELPDVFTPGTAVLTAAGGALTVSAVRPHKDHLLVGFEEVADRTSAEAMRNLELLIEADRRPLLSSDEFWISDLVGLQAQTTGGAQLGIVSSVITSETQDRLVIDTGHDRVEVPFVPELVPEVLETHIVVDPPEGLFD
ncbi:MAG: 16S rRNA processing protein RimM [Acidimicrobiia bacterium]|nr:ribosome maturation factor RimM [Acidimicrobiia bacterium]MBT8193959.1 ribosome maturation factor RimM [Acidimicrobiia bacterium]MBT8246557.1 ribosome maturation factor RimM [Acidimicrobiia bacterium]NNF89062.1 16S rRNA processing protein RimM [Acidimicrobiia bacterium]NNJ47551.1 16S rRNA processing protein RimM [Acidimicrobiia bacterium]